MALRDLAVAGVPSDLRGPVQQGNVQQAVDDQPAVLRRIRIPPGLNISAGGLVAGHQLVRRLDGSFFGTGASRQLIGRDTGGDVQKTHVMMVDSQLFVDALQKGFHLLAANFSQSGFYGFDTGVLIGQPYLAGPEAAGPVVDSVGIFAGGVEIALTVGVGEMLLKGGHIVQHLRDAAVHCLPQLRERRVLMGHNLFQ